MRILILTDSVSLPRKVPERTSYAQTYPALLKDSDEVYQISIGGATSEDILKQCVYYSQFEVDIVILQVGIVDCAPRFMTKGELAFFKRIPFFGLRIIKILNTSFIRKLRKLTYTTEHKFERNISGIINSFKEKKVIVLGIIPAVEQYEKTLPGVSKNITRYNAILQKTPFFVDLTGIESYGMMTDHHHVNAEGHLFIYSKLISIIRPDA